MLTIKKNSASQWELLLKVLSEEMLENDPKFQRWLEEDIENKNLYTKLKGKGQGGESFDKDKAFGNVSDILGFSIRRRVLFYQKKWFKYTASIFFVASVGLTGYFTFQNKNTPESIKYSKTNIFDPDLKNACLFSSEGETLDLSETFEFEKDDGTIISNKGGNIVSFQQNESAKKKAEQQTIYVPKGGVYELLLADGSKVHINSETQLTFPNYFEGDKRQVELTGEAYFEVQKSNKPFIVKTAEMQIEVLGTSFNVNAYQDNASVHTTLVEGSVQIHVADNPKIYLLKPENNFSIDKYSNEVSIQEVNTEIYTAWMKGELIFRNQSLNDIFLQLARWYDFKIEYENPAIQTMRFTGSAQKEKSLDYLLNQIQSVTDIKYRREREKIILY